MLPDKTRWDEFVKLTAEAWERYQQTPGYEDYDEYVKAADNAVAIIKLRRDEI